MLSLMCFHTALTTRLLNIVLAASFVACVGRALDAAWLC